jgi:hypothetical protein
VTRGYAVFDLAELPPTAVVTGVEFHYNVAAIGTGGSGGNQTRGYAGDLSTITVPGTLYTTMGAAPTIYPTGPSYGGIGNQFFATAAAAETFVQTNVGTKVSVVMATVGPRVYTVTGETGTATPTGAHAPYLKVDYTCPDITSITASAPLPAPCPNEAFTLTGSATGTIASYLWNGPAGFSSTMANPTISAGLGAGATYTLTVTDVNGCSAKTTAVVTVNPAPVTTISPVTITAFCTGGSATLDAPGGAGNTCQWYNNGVAIPGATDQIYVADTTGNYQIEITDANGCTAMTPFSTPTLELVDLPVSPAGPVLLCSGDNGALTVNTNTVTTGLTFQWQKDGVNIPGSTGTTHIVTVTGVYRCVVTEPTAPCSTNSQAVTVDVNDYPLPVVSYAGSNLATSNVYAQYQWFLNTIAIAGATNFVYTPTTTGNYRVRVTDGNGCTAFSSGYPVNIVTGTEILSAAAVKIYPNPASDVLHITTPVKVHVVISSMEGRVLVRSNDTNTVNIEQLEPGMYLVSMFNEAGDRIKVERITKQ